LHGLRHYVNILRVPNELRMKTVGQRDTRSPDVWEAVRQLTETAERSRKAAAGSIRDRQ